MTAHHLAAAAGAVLALASIPVLVACAYLGLLTLLSGRPKAGPRTAAVPRVRFAVLVPSHNEEAGIAATVQNLLALDYPRALFRVIVIADNCADATALRAAAAGAEVFERQDASLRGKGYALDFAFGKLLAEGKTDAVLIIDADTVASPNCLTACAARLEAGEEAVQLDYAVHNVDASWRTRLMAIALGMFHIVRSQGRERLGVSCGLRGNGMCFATALLRRVPHHAYSVVEDLEYGIRLGEAGTRVAYAGEGHVYGEMVSGEKSSRTQRRRWEAGRAAIVQQHGLRLLRAAFARRSGLLLDLALDVLVPPLSTVVALAVGGLLAALVLVRVAGAPAAALVPWVLCVALLALYVLRGWMVSGTGARGLADLALAPAYMAWKVTLLFRRSRSERTEWVRTAREGRGP